MNLTSEQPNFFLRLRPLQIRLTKATLLLGDVLWFGLAGLLAAWLAERWSMAAELHWLVMQDLER